MALVCLTAPATAATQNEFYTSLLRRGVASFDASRYPDAAKQLRIAAFGLVDAIEHYQLAQMYLTLTYDKLGLTEKARESAHRVTVAERVERRYAAVSAPQPVRAAFETLAARLLSPAELAILRGGPAPPPASVPQTTAPPPPQTSAAPAQTVTKPPAPKRQPVQQQPAIVTPAPQKPTHENAAPQTSVTKPVVKPAPMPVTATAGRGGPLEPARAAAPAPRPLTANEISARLATAERALNGADLPAARNAYRELLAAPGLDHDALIRVAEGLYRARDFAAALNAFNRIGTLRRGEEPYRYYVAVAAYESGDYARAKKELAAALPYIEVTPDVARYRTRIEGAQ
ncbi:MAG: hypothetical protein ACJ74H_10300 [Thermoanaerobaculia bacterium]